MLMLTQKWGPLTFSLQPLLYHGETIGYCIMVHPTDRPDRTRVNGGPGPGETALAATRIISTNEGERIQVQTYRPARSLKDPRTMPGVTDSERAARIANIGGQRVLDSISEPYERGDARVYRYYTPPPPDPEPARNEAAAAAGGGERPKEPEVAKVPGTAEGEGPVDTTGTARRADLAASRAGSSRRTGSLGGLFAPRRRMSIDQLLAEKSPPDRKGIILTGTDELERYLPDYMGVPRRIDAPVTEPRSWVRPEWRVFFNQIQLYAENVHERVAVVRDMIRGKPVLIVYRYSGRIPEGSDVVLLTAPHELPSLPDQDLLFGNGNLTPRIFQDERPRYIVWGQDSYTACYSNGLSVTSGGEAHRGGSGDSGFGPLPIF
jgi:hypothetical protein